MQTKAEKRAAAIARARGTDTSAPVAVATPAVQEDTAATMQSLSAPSTDFVGSIDYGIPTPGFTGASDAPVAPFVTTATEEVLPDVVVDADVAAFTAQVSPVAVELAPLAALQIAERIMSEIESGTITTAPGELAAVRAVLAGLVSGAVATPAAAATTTTRNASKGTARLIQPPMVLVGGKQLRKMWCTEVIGRYLVGITTEYRGWAVRDTLTNLDENFPKGPDGLAQAREFANDQTADQAEEEGYDANVAATQHAAALARVASDLTSR